MKICKKCNLQFEDEMQFCSKCGGTLEEQILEAEPVENIPEKEQGQGFEIGGKQELWSWEFWLSPNGRRNRKPYILYNVAVWLLSGVIALLTAVPLVGWAFGVLLFYANCINVIKRLHDVDMSGWWAVVPAVVSVGLLAAGSLIIGTIAFFVNVFLWIYLIFKKGTEGENKYGSDPLEV